MYFCVYLVLLAVFCLFWLTQRHFFLLAVRLRYHDHEQLSMLYEYL